MFEECCAICNGTDAELSDCVVCGAPICKECSYVCRRCGKTVCPGCQDDDDDVTCGHCTDVPNETLRKQ